MRTPVALSNHALDRLAEYLPNESLDLVEQIISSASITVACGWKQFDGWQKKEFRVFWFAGAAWVAVINIRTGHCLSVIPAWREADQSGICLYENFEGANRIVAHVEASHIRRAISALNDGTVAPEKFESSRYMVSARILLKDGQVKIIRLGKFDAFRDEAKKKVLDEKFMTEQKLVIFARFSQEEIRGALLFASNGSHLFESVLVEAVCVGGW